VYSSYDNSTKAQIRDLNVFSSWKVLTPLPRSLFENHIVTSVVFGGYILVIGATGRREWTEIDANGFVAQFIPPTDAVAAEDGQSRAGSYHQIHQWSWPSGSFASTPRLPTSLRRHLYIHVHHGIDHKSKGNKSDDTMILGIDIGGDPERERREVFALPARNVIWEARTTTTNQSTSTTSDTKNRVGSTSTNSGCSASSGSSSDAHGNNDDIIVHPDAWIRLPHSSHLLEDVSILSF
jgi:hypothetical protein